MHRLVLHSPLADIASLHAAPYTRIKKGYYSSTRMTAAHRKFNIGRGDLVSMAATMLYLSIDP